MNVDSSKVTEQYEEDEEEEEETENPKTIATVSKFHGWNSTNNDNSNNSSRIFRVSRATGGKDRHSKVLTSKGLRDRRVRLSVSTAIAFYDLQDRLGYDQPSKAVEWLIKASEEAISELPVLDTSFSTDATFKIRVNGNDDDVRMDRDLLNPNSETSKGCSRLSSSLSRPESRVRARERAREIKAAKEKERIKENELRIGDLPTRVANTQNQTLISQNASFTELLTNGLFGLSRSASSNQDYSTPSMMMAPFSVTGDDRQQHQQQSSEMQQYSPEMQHYDLNFRMSSSGFNNRGTLQSNLSVPSLFPQFHQRFSSSVDGSSNNVPFFMGAMAAPSASASSENNNNSGSHHHYSQFDTGFDDRLHLFHGDGTPHTDQKGKRKS